MYVLGPDLPQVLGASAPKGNYADLKTIGWEISLGWKDRVRVGNDNLSYNLKFMVWDSQSWITKYLGNENQLLSSYYVGQRLGDIWGYTIEGLFRLPKRSPLIPTSRNWLCRRARSFFQ